MALRRLPPSPFLRGSFPVPLSGPHLSWFTDLSEAMQGSTGKGTIQDDNGNNVGEYKAVGGIVHAWFTLPPGIHVITFPSIDNAGPCHVSDGSILWPDSNGRITVSCSVNVKGWITFRG